MENAEFRYTKTGRYLGLVFLLPLVIFLLAQIVSLLKPKELIEKYSVGQYPTPWGVVGFLILASLFLFEIWLFVGMGLFPLKYKIILSQSSIKIQAGNAFGRWLISKINNNAYYVGEIPYESIRSVDIDPWRPGTAKLLFPSGGQVLISVRSLERSVEFVEQLTSKLSGYQIGEGIRKLVQPKRFKVLQKIIYTLAFMPTFLTFFLLFVDEWNPKIWNEELSSWSVLAVSLDTDGTLWANAGGYKDNVYVWRLSENSREHWMLPQEICGKCRVYTVSHNSQGFPVVVDNTFDSSVIYKWDESRWNRTTLDAYFFNTDFHAVDTRIWGTRNENLIYIDFATDEVVEIPSPAEVFSNGLNLQDFNVNQDGSIFAEFIAKDKPNILYRFTDGDWQKLIEFPTSDQRIWDSYQDVQGNVWVLVENTVKDQIEVGCYDLQNETWSWSDLKLTNSEREFALFNDLAVDSKGRIWISGMYDRRDDKDHFLDFVMAAEWTDDGIKPIVEYTDKNSNLDSADQFVMTDDRTWMNNLRLYWIDATTEELPSPLPDWVVWLKEFYENHFGWYFLILLGQIALAIIGTSLEYK